MAYRIPKKGELYRHFKGNLYEVIVIARDSETLEEMVVYKEMDGEAVYVRPLRMFVSKVDHEKYPDVLQEYRFEHIQRIETEEIIESEEEEVSNNSMILDFLELTTASEKIQYLQSVREYINEEFLTVVAQSLEYVERDESLIGRYEALIHYLKILARYEYR